MNRIKESLLLYLETRIVDYRGFVDPRYMNAEDFEIARRWNDKGFIVFRRIPFKKIEQLRMQKSLDHSTSYVKFSKVAWNIAHRLRKVRGMRQMKKQGEILVGI